VTSRWITVLVAMVAITIAAAASLVLAPYPLTLLSLVCIAAILASSVNLLVGQAGLLSLGHAGISASAGYAVAWGAVRDMDPLVQVAIALGVTILVSLAYGLMTMRTRGIVFLMITLALGMIVYGLAQKLPTLTGARTPHRGGSSRARRRCGPLLPVTLTSLVRPSLHVLRSIDRRSGLRSAASRERGTHGQPGLPGGTRQVLARSVGTAGRARRMLAAWQAQFREPAVARSAGPPSRR